MQLMIYYDYLCEDSYQIFRWLERIGELRPEVRTSWATFSLREFNRAEGEPSYLEGDKPRDPSILALALAHAARQADFSAYHKAVFDAVQGEGRAMTEADLLKFAADAGVDVTAFQGDQGRWIQEVAHDHEYGRRRWGVRSTPTLTINSRAAAMVKISEPPEADSRTIELLDRIALLLTDFPELKVIKRTE